MAALRTAAHASVSVLLVVAACQSLVGIEDSPPALPDAGSGGDAAPGGAAGAGGVAGSPAGGTAGVAGAAGAAGTGGAADAGCGSARPPPATSGADPGGNIEFVVAIRELDLGDRSLADGPSWPKLGYDLDKLCTCGTDTAGSCKAATTPRCDGVDGRDNALGAFLHQVRTVFQLTSVSSEALTTKIEGGGNTVLLRVRGYNGTADDAVVEVDWYASDDFDVTNAAPPKWDGSDEWPVLSSSLNATTGSDGGPTFNVDDAKFADKLAYVTNGTLVANLPEGSFSLTPSTSIGFTAALLTAKIETVSGGGWSLEDGVVAGITQVGAVLGLLPSIDDPNSNPICTDHLFYGVIKTMICGYPDMTILGSPAKPCDYLSLGVSLKGDPAKLGPVVVKPTKPSACPAGTDPAQDKCEP